jgi:hypothetical protein
LIKRTFQLGILLLGMLFGDDATFKTQCNQLGVDTTLVVHSEAVDEYLVWSPDSSSLGINVNSQWKELRLDDLKLIPAKWHGSAIALAKNPELKPLSPSEIERWQSGSPQHRRVLQLQDRSCIRLKEHELSTWFEMTDARKQTRVLWRTDLENCHSPSLSPDQKYLAYICELNGVMVSDVNKLFTHAGDPVEENDECIDIEPQPIVHRIILPEGYVGWIRIDYLVKTAPELDEQTPVIRVAENGTFRTSSHQIFGASDMVKYEFFYQTPNGVRAVPDDLVPEEIYDASIFAQGSWYFLLAPRSYREKQPLHDMVKGLKPLPTPGRLPGTLPQ